MPGRDVLAFDDLRPFLLVRNGNDLYKVPFRDGHAVLKVYAGSRGLGAQLWKSAANAALYRKTSYMPRTRCRIERDTLALWRTHGFRTFATYDVEVRAPACPPDAHLLLEYVDAPRLDQLMTDEDIDPDARFAAYRAWLPEWSHRHDLAIARDEPRLIHENGDLGHVLRLGDGSHLWFDLEMVYRPGVRVADLVAREIVQYVWDLHKQLPESLRHRLIAETVAGYPAPDRIRRAREFFFAHANPLYRAARTVDRMRRRARKPTSKYAVADLLRDELARTG